MTRMLFAFVAGVTLARAAVPEARSNDNRRPAGRLDSGALTVRLEVREATWNPEGDNGPQLPIYAFAEEGKAPQTPGPMIRVTAGTEYGAQVRNDLTTPVVLRDLEDHGSSALRHGLLSWVRCETRETGLPGGPPGHLPLLGSHDRLAPRQAGSNREPALRRVRDPRCKCPPDRIFVLGHWAVTATYRKPRLPSQTARRTFINGKCGHRGSCLRYAVAKPSLALGQRHGRNPPASHARPLLPLEAKGDETHWRRCRSRSAAGGHADGPLRHDPRPLPGVGGCGNWLFHCHVLFHVMPFVA